MCDKGETYTHGTTLSLLYIYVSQNETTRSLTMRSILLIMQESYFDDESAEVVISSLRLGDDQGR